MANTVNYVSYSHFVGSSSQDFEFRFVVTFSGSYVNGTGETINFLTALNPNGLELNGFIPPVTLPEGIPDSTPNMQGQGYNVSALTTSGTVVLKFYSAVGTELGSGAYSAAVTAGQITFAIRVRG